MTTDHERFAELAAGHALHALEPADEQAFRVHLSDCADCRRETALHTDTLGHLAYAAAPAALPVGILAGIRAEIGDARLLPLPQPAAEPISLAAARTRRTRRTLDSRTWLGAAAAAALVMSLGVWNVALHRDQTQGNVRASRLQTAVQTLEHGAEHSVQLKDSNGQPVAVAVVGADTVSLVIDGLAPNDMTWTYVLWQRGKYGVIRPLGRFDVHGKGVAVMKNMPLARDIAGVEGFAVTREPGHRAPTSPGSSPVATGAVTA